MFEQALLESARHAPGTQRTCSTAASLLLQSALLAGFVLVPVLASQVAPTLHERLITIPLPRFESPAPRIESTGPSAGPSVSTIARELLQPRTIPTLDRNPPDTDAVPTAMHSVAGNPNSVLTSILSGTRDVAPPAESLHKQQPVSVLEQGVVISRVQPIYPHIAIVNRIQGSVHLNAVIAINGSLQDLRVLSGDPTLARAAHEAVEQWKFRPYVLNGKPIEVQTEVIVNFLLN